MSKTREIKARETAFYAIFSAQLSGGDPCETVEGVVEGLIEPDNRFRRLAAAVDFDKIIDTMNVDKLPSFKKTGFTPQSVMKTVFLQFFKDFSDLKMEKALKDKLDMRWFCRYNICKPSPDAAFLKSFRSEMGSSGIFRFLKIVEKNMENTDFAQRTDFPDDAAALLEITSRWEEEDEKTEKSHKTLKSGSYNGFSVQVQNRIRTLEKNSEQIDNVIRENLKKGSFESLAQVAKALLRLGLCEMEYIRDIPPDVAINEAVEMAATFGDESLASFVNGLLDSRYKALKEKGVFSEQKR